MLPPTNPMCFFPLSFRSINSMFIRLPCFYPPLTAPTPPLPAHAREHTVLSLILLQYHSPYFPSYDIPSAAPCLFLPLLPFTSAFAILILWNLHLFVFLRHATPNPTTLHTIYYHFISAFPPPSTTHIQCLSYTILYLSPLQPHKSYDFTILDSNLKSPIQCCHPWLFFAFPGSSALPRLLT